MDFNRAGMLLHIAEKRKDFPHLGPIFDAVERELREMAFPPAKPEEPLFPRRSIGGTE